MLDVIKEILEGCNKNVAALAIVGSLIVGKSVLNVSFFGSCENCTSQSHKIFPDDYFHCHLI
jgi:hypothetical protein